MKLNDKDEHIIRRMLKYCDDICALMKQYDNSFLRYRTEIAFQYSCGMCLIQIDELAGRVSEEAARANPGITWRAIKGMRNIHAHDYDRIDHSIV
ncbi:MAG: DUF86 domain-containing protein [Synergistaceae bacterium]|nr:DUF86 domain-containing protein [Synergistaceae bacterium]